MIFRKLGNTDIQLSVIGLGTWAIGGGDYRYGWGSQDDRESISTIRHSVELGINWIDTAPVYGLGHSEKIVGQAIKGIRDKVFISTKCGFRWNENKEIFTSLKKESIRNEIEESLKRLNIETIDLYQIHKPVPEEIEEGWKTLNDLIKEGKIRFAGVSSFNLEQVTGVQKQYPVSFTQPAYSMIQPEIQENGILDFCGAHHIGVVAYSPMGSGLLTGKFTKERVDRLPADDWRLKEAPFFQEPDLSANLRLVERLRPIAEQNNRTLAQLSIAWVLSRPEVTSAIVGARRSSQIEQTVLAGDWVLSDKDRSELDNILDDHHKCLNELKKGN